MASSELVVAGVLATRFDSLSELTESEIENALRESLVPGSLWESVGRSRPSGSEVIVGTELTRWVDPPKTESSGRSDRSSLTDIWRNVSTRNGNAPTEYLRLAVDSIQDARRLQALGPVGGRVVSPIITRRVRRFEWRWPLHVAIVPGPRSSAWLASLQDPQKNRYVDTLYSVEIANSTRADSYEIVIVDTRDLFAPSWDPAFDNVLRSAGCVIITGAADLDATFAQVLTTWQPNTTIAMPSDDVSWWTDLFYEMCHDVPIDAAARHSLPDALVAGDARALIATAVGHWAILASKQSGFPEIAAGIEDMEFAHEDQGATQISERVKALPAGSDPTVRMGGETAAMRPPSRTDQEPSTSPQKAVKVPGRRLVVDFLSGGKSHKKTLPPHTDVSLSVKIAVPKRGDLAGGVDVQPDTAADSATIDVIVRSSLWTGEQVEHLELSMSDPLKSSDTVSFPFVTGPEGEIATFDVLLHFNNHPLQSAKINIAVREKAIPGDRAQILTGTFSNGNEPGAHMRPADTMLDTRRTSHTQSVPGLFDMLDDVEGMLTSIERIATGVIGLDNAPNDFNDERVLPLLIALAQIGHRIKQRTDHFGIASAKSIVLLVDVEQKILPLELAYEGAAPTENATLCTKHRNSPPLPGSTCTNVSDTVVCPYAFWGMHRRIHRSVQLAPAAVKSAATRLPIEDVAFAVAAQVDFGAPANQPRPSEVLAESARQFFHANQKRPITSWIRWKAAISRRRPGLLVVMGHFEPVQQQPRLFLGRASSLGLSNIARAYIRSPKGSAPLAILMACSTGTSSSPFGNLPGTFLSNGAGAVIATLTKLPGRHGALASQEIMRAIAEADANDSSLGAALFVARRALIAQGVLLGILLVNHGNLDLKIERKV